MSEPHSCHACSPKIGGLASESACCNYVPTVGDTISHTLHWMWKWSQNYIHKAVKFTVLALVIWMTNLNPQCNRAYVIRKRNNSQGQSFSRIILHLYILDPSRSRYGHGSPILSNSTTLKLLLSFCWVVSTFPECIQCIYLPMNYYYLTELEWNRLLLDGIRAK